MTVGMAEIFDLDARRSIRMALARDAYNRNLIRIADSDVSGFDWLVATHRGVYAVSDGNIRTTINGWFFGICRHEDRFYLFENCGLRDRASELGRIIRIDLANGQLVNPVVLITGLDANCHQVRIIDGRLCVVDTANQAILRYTLAGHLVDVKHPFAVAPSTDRTGVYLHLNGLAKIGSRIAIMRNNSKVSPEKQSELAWLDSNWSPVAIDPLAGHWCHDIVEDESGNIWHCGSKAGDILISDGRKIHVTDDLLTRGLQVSKNRIIVGASEFGERRTRDGLPGTVIIFDRAFNKLSELQLNGPPTDIAPLRV